MIISNKYQAEAFSEEVQVSRYLVFARQAEKEGFPQIAAIFRAAAQEETVQAQAHLQGLRPIGSGRERLWEGISGEKSDQQDIPSLMLIAAAQEGRTKPPGSSKSGDGEKMTHTAAYRQALARLAELAKGDYHVCSECGYTRERQHLEKCPHCQSEAITWVKVG